jgi:hypothetical protein
MNQVCCEKYKTIEILLNFYLSDKCNNVRLIVAKSKQLTQISKSERDEIVDKSQVNDWMNML